MTTNVIVTIVLFVVSMQVALLVYIAKKFDQRLERLEKEISQVAVLLDRGQRQDAEIARLRDKVDALALAVASAGQPQTRSSR